MKSHLIFSVAFSMLMQGCMPAKSSGGGTAQPPVKTPTSDNQTGTAGVLSDISAATMMVTQNGAKVSLADIAKRSSSQISVFQFVGITCEECKTEGPYVAQALSKYGSTVSRTLLFPNGISEYQDSDYRRFSATHAANAPYAVDDTLSVIKRTRANTTQYFGIFIILNKAGQGMILNATGAYKTVDAAVAKALGQ